jgi:alpha-beta hydrolase superfamily lysophospholipase
MPRQSQGASFQSHDGNSLFYRCWAGKAGVDARAIVLFQAQAEQESNLQHWVDGFDLPECHFFACNVQAIAGAGVPQGALPDFATLVKNADGLVRHIGRQHGIAMENMAVIAQGAAAVAIAAWVHDYAPKIAAMVLLAASFQRRFANRFSAPDEAKGLRYSARRISNDAAAIFAATQLIIAGDDAFAERGAQELFFARIASSVKEKHVIDGVAHDVLGQPPHAGLLPLIRNFVQQRFSHPAALPDLRNAHLAGVTFDELARLKQPPGSNLANLYWALTRATVRALAWVSEGMKIGADTGFDSGSTLDYVYRNQSQGVTPLGKMVDRFYLDSISWRGIRVRKPHVESLIARAITQLRQANQPIRIVDIAAGHGRYILEVLARQKQLDVDILLRDFAPVNIEQGRQLIAKLGMQDCARFELGDGFDRASLAQITPRPTLAVACGLYELFPDNTLVHASLAGLADALDSGSYLVYTTNPWHPQLEMVARGLTTHRDGHSQFFMRRRFQAEMDQMVEAAGFVKLDQLIDEWGIFSVSLAQKK